MMRLLQITPNTTQKHSTTRYRGRFVVVLAVLLALSGCGQDDGADSTQPDTGIADASSDAFVDSDAREDVEEDTREDSYEVDATPDAPDVEPEELLSESSLQQFERMVEVDGHPTIVVGVVEGDASRVYGFGALDSGAEPNGQTLYEIGSVTKTFTALLLADAIESDEVSLDTPLQELLPDFEIPTRNSKEITLEMLATHHSGLPRMPSGVSALDPFDFGAEELRDFLANYTLPRDPGASYEYSNLGFGLLGYALGERAGSSYSTAMKTDIIEPLGLSSTYTELQDAPADRLAKGYNSAGNPTPNLEFQVIAGAGAIISDADDMLAYLGANMGLIDTPLYPAMQLAHQPRAGGRSGPDETGLAWVSNSFRDKTVVWHGGLTGGYTTFVGFLADGSRGLVILTNIAKPVDTAGISTLLEGSSGDDETIDMTPEELDEYVGEYRLDAQLTITVYREGTQLMSQATGQGAFPIFPSAKDEFFARIAPITITFERDDDEQIAALILHQNGSDFHAPRVPGD